MKLNGKKLDTPNIETIVFPRANGEDIIFKAQAVLDLNDFEKLCPEPKPPRMIKRGSIEPMDNVEDPAYKQSIFNHNKLRMDWLILQSLRATEELEWETVKYDDPSTWASYEQELKDSKFSLAEVQRIRLGVMAANSLSESKIEEARQRFFMREASKKLENSSQEVGQLNTQSGAPANG